MYNPCFVFCCKTWLHEGINGNLIYVLGYKILRRDRKHMCSGGLCTFYQNTLQVIQVELDFVVQNFDQVCFVCENVIYIVIYLPPGLTINYIRDAFDSITGNVDKILNSNQVTFVSWRFQQGTDFKHLFQFEFEEHCDRDQPFKQTSQPLPFFNLACI